MKLTINDLKRGSVIEIHNVPCMVLSVKHVHMGRGGASVQVKIKDLKTGKVLDRSFKSADNFEEAKIERMDVVFIYNKGSEYWFHETGNPSNRFPLSADTIGGQVKFIKPKMEVRAFMFKDEVINVELPIKADYEVIDAPPSIKGNTSQGGSKVITIEGGAKITTPLFIKVGHVIRVNTETGEYGERI